jgi:predicted dehydrogenase
MAETVRVGVVGTGVIADLLHLPALRSHPRAAVAAVCGRDRARTEAVAARHGRPRAFTDYRAMVDAGGLDAVVVATPDDLHHPVTMAALEAGLHVLCEKPLAPTAELAGQMLRRAEAAGVRHMVMFTMRWVPAYRYLRGLVGAGYIGRPYQVSLRFLGGAARAGAYGWRFDAARGTGVLGDFGAHLVDLARLLVGEVTRVSAHLSAPVDLRGAAGEAVALANQAAVVALEFAGGAQGVIEVSALAHLGERRQEQHVALHGADGTLGLALSLFTGETDLRGIRAGESAFQQLAVPSRLGGSAEPWGFAELLELFRTESVGTRLFVDAVLGEAAEWPTFADGVRAQEVLDAAAAAHARGAWVRVPTTEAR